VNHSSIGSLVGSLVLLLLVILILHLCTWSMVRTMSHLQHDKQLRHHVRLIAFQVAGGSLVSLGKKAC
jgi:hypothetical protein